jgi:membrane-bound lytic murein transglycosylase MltF
MVNAGLVDATVVDRYKAVMWARIFKDLDLHNDAAVHTDAQNAFMMRKGSPKLKAALAEFVKAHEKARRSATPSSGAM